MKMKCVCGDAEMTKHEMSEHLKLGNCEEVFFLRIISAFGNL